MGYQTDLTFKQRNFISENFLGIFKTKSKANLLINGRWVVERTFSWFESFRRLNRNYERFPHPAKGVAMAACAMFKLLSPRPIVTQLRPLVSVTMEPHRSLTARTQLHNA
ncbi:MAG: transposase [Bacteroides sp.]|nr:transposase [Bacteroides sp.]